MNHLEQLVYEYYDWLGYLVKSNINVGKRKQGGYEMELDVVAYHPHTRYLIHIETSLDANSWEKRKERYLKKIESGKKYIFSEVFTWLSENQVVDQQIISIHKAKDGFLGGIKVITIDDFMSKVIGDIIIGKGKAFGNAIPQKYPLLRTIQFCICGYATKPQY